MAINPTKAPTVPPVGGYVPPKPGTQQQQTRTQLPPGFQPPPSNTSPILRNVGNSTGSFLPTTTTPPPAGMSGHEGLSTPSAMAGLAAAAPHTVGTTQTNQGGGGGNLVDLQAQLGLQGAYENSGRADAAKHASDAAAQGHGFDTESASQKHGYDTEDTRLAAQLEGESDTRHQTLTKEDEERRLGQLPGILQLIGLGGTAGGAGSDAKSVGMSGGGNTGAIGMGGTDPFMTPQHLDSVTNGGSNTPLSVGTSGGGGFTDSATPPRAADPESEARSAIFNRAKDQQGQIGRSAIDSLHGLAASGGYSGSGMERAGEASVVNNAASGLGDVTREQMINEAARAGQISDRDYAGGLTRRGQDITTRGQNVSMLPSLLGLIQSHGSAY